MLPHRFGLLISIDMKLSLHWINSYLDRPIDAAELQAVLTQQGLAVEGTEPIGDDLAVEVEVTSNRSDCQSHVGLAREVAAGTGRTLVLPDCGLGDMPDGAADVDSLTSVQTQDLDLCPLYTARVIQGVAVGPSPKWLVDRLEVIGLRSVNNVVDVTNFVLFELGQPLHTFDMNKLGEQRIVVRRARQDETFTAIDGTQHQLQNHMLVIADNRVPVAVAGVMGGTDSEVGDATTDILLESAIFQPLSVRRTSRTLKLSSDSSYRFERGVDPLGVDRASRRTARLIVELAGGKLAKGVVCVGADDPSPRGVELRLARCRQLLGIDIEPQRVIELLSRLGLVPALDDAGATVACTIPSHRLDLHREVDLIEEVARLHGLDEVPVCQRIEIVAQGMRPSVAARQKLGQLMVAAGYHETITFSFIAQKLGQPFLRPGESAVVIDDEQRRAEPMLRPSLLPSLLACRKSNQDAGNTDVALYEVAGAWVRKDGQIIERPQLAMLRDAPDADLALRSARGVFDELVRQLVGQINLEVTPADDSWCCHGLHFMRQRSVVGAIGLATPAVLERFDLKAPLVLGQFDLPMLIEQYPPPRRVVMLARFPAIERDLSVIVDETVTWDRIETGIRQTRPALMEQLIFLDTYRGKPIPKGRKSVSFRMTFRDPQGTLRHEQVDPQVSAVVDQLRQDLAIELRA